MVGNRTTSAFSDNELLRMWSLASLFTKSKNEAIFERLINDDALWVLFCSYLVLTMRTGFGALHCGCVSIRNTAHTLIRNVVDVSFGGLTFWVVGYGIAFGDPYYYVVGLSRFLMGRTTYEEMGTQYTHYFYQLSFASMACTIVCGAVAGRMKFEAYLIFVVFNTIAYAFGAGWVWNQHGWLRQIGFFDFAGVSVVHLFGGTAALVAAVMLGPRRNRYTHYELYEMSNPVLSFMGMFLLLWAWLPFNAGSTFGMQGIKWKVSAIAAATTMNGATGGAIVSFVVSAVRHEGKTLARYIIYGTLGGLVSVTGCCGVVTMWEALLIGMVSAGFAIVTYRILENNEIDDPVGSTAIHLGPGIWGTLATGIFASDFNHTYIANLGILHSLSGRLILAQLVGLVAIVAWSALSTFLTLSVIKCIMGIRIDMECEIQGEDSVKHGLDAETAGTKLLAALFRIDDDLHLDEILEKVATQLREKPQNEEEGKRTTFDEDFAFQSTITYDDEDEKTSSASSSDSSDWGAKKKKKKKKKKEKAKKKKSDSFDSADLMPTSRPRTAKNVVPVTTRAPVTTSVPVVRPTTAQVAPAAADVTRTYSRHLPPSGTPLQGPNLATVQRVPVAGSVSNLQPLVAPGPGIMVPGVARPPPRQTVTLLAPSSAQQGAPTRVGDDDPNAIPTPAPQPTTPLPPIQLHSSMIAPITVDNSKMLASGTRFTSPDAPMSIVAMITPVPSSASPIPPDDPAADSRPNTSETEVPTAEVKLTESSKRERDEGSKKGKETAEAPKGKQSSQDKDDGVKKDKESTESPNDEQTSLTSSKNRRESKDTKHDSGKQQTDRPKSGKESSKDAKETPTDKQAGESPKGSRKQSVDASSKEAKEATKYAGDKPKGPAPDESSAKETKETNKSTGAASKGSGKQPVDISKIPGDGKEFKESLSYRETADIWKEKVSSKRPQTGKGSRSQSPKAPHKSTLKTSGKSSNYSMAESAEAKSVDAVTKNDLNDESSKVDAKQLSDSFKDSTKPKPSGGSAKQLPYQDDDVPNMPVKKPIETWTTTSADRGAAEKRLEYAETVRTDRSSNERPATAASTDPLVRPWK